MGRPQKPIDEDQVFLLASFGLTNKEIAATVDCSVSTLTNRFDDIIKEGHERRNGSLRRKQYEVAMGGNAALLIWLGKQYLGQTEKVETAEISAKEAINRGRTFIRGIRGENAGGHNVLNGRTDGNPAAAG